MNPKLPSLTRRQLFQLSAAGIAAHSSSGWIEALAADAATNPARRRACIVLWMSGGPSQMDTFDLKPGHENGGPFKAIDTAAPGVKISEHLPKLAREMKDVALIRSMSTKEGDHGRATYNLRTGYLPQGPIQYPSLGALVAKELEGDGSEMPGFVSIAPYRLVSPAAFSSGFLGPQYAPLVVGEVDLITIESLSKAFGAVPKVDDLERPASVSAARSDARMAMLDGLEGDFVAKHARASAVSHRTAYTRAASLMRSPAVKAFDLERENPRLRDAYGRSSFGQGCLLARRLVQAGVPFVEVTLSGVPGDRAVFDWDTHSRNFESVHRLSEVLDAAWSTLLQDLRAHGLLESTLVVWMGEFGRTPKINAFGGRDHYPTAWTTALAGGGIKGGQFIGRTSADGSKVEERMLTVPDFLATICRALGIDPRKQNMSSVGRPIRIVDPKAKAISELLA
jgi:uncharacterized protein (DUF1501 family)